MESKKSNNYQTEKKGFIDKLGKKKVFAIGAAIIAVGVIVVVAIFMQNDSKEVDLTLKKDKFVLEYGEAGVSSNPSTYLKTTDKDILEKSKVNITPAEYMCSSEKCENEVLKEFTGVGVYSVSIIYNDGKDHEQTVDVEIKDTKSPEFVDFKDKIEVDQDSTEDLTTKFTAKDLSAVKITVNMEGVDISKVGEYKTKVIAEDWYKNKTEKEVTIVVKEKTTEDENDDQNTDQDSQTNGNTSGGSDSTGGSTGGSTNTGGSSSAGNSGGTTPTPTADVCPGGYDPSLPCDAIITDTREGQSHMMFDTSAEVENIMNLMAYGEFDKIEAITGEDLSPYMQIKGAQVMYNNGVKKYTFRVYY
ncbi:hypothetical protein [Breznakia pachnodae]|uniref:Membrane protein YgcG n=1 Tax=Breznakia pachnodae TaxID=265178 RepID=A0ABU0E415_9FIRM|nr:hypothetical protein [Breznakia pachnodae]MDQ0361571.1 putative membrane protein YgcG [Breznakia pachnodae]